MNSGGMIMRIKSILTGAAVGLTLVAGSAFAAEPFAVLDGIPAEPLNAEEMAAVEGRVFVRRVVSASSFGSNTLTLSTSSRGSSSSSLLTGIAFPHRCPGTPCGQGGRLTGWML